MSTITEAKELAALYMKTNIPSFMAGPPGIGKTETWQQIAKEQGIGFISLELNQLDPVDLRGLPGRSKNEDDVDISNWALPDFLPNLKRDGEKGILLFDEMSDLSKAMQSASYSLILQGKAGPHSILPGWYRAAAGNRRADRAAAQPMSTALASRFAWIDVEPDVNTFCQWGISNGIDPLIIGFLRFRPNLIHSMEGANEQTFPCPRQWARASRLVGASTGGNLRYVALKGLIGEGAASEFEAFLKVTNLPELKDILNNPTGLAIPKEPGTRYAIAAMLARGAERGNFEKILQYTRRNDFGRDFEIATVLDATKRAPELTETKAFTEFSVRNQDLTI